MCRRLLLNSGATVGAGASQQHENTRCHLHSLLYWRPPLWHRSLSRVTKNDTSKMNWQVVVFVLCFLYGIDYHSLCMIVVQVFQDNQPQKEEEDEKANWVKIVGGPFTEEDNFCADLRRLQQRSGCSDAACDDIVRTFQKYLGIDAPKNFRSYDKSMQQAAGAKMLRLNGCPSCKRHVYLPTDKEQCCPRIKANGSVCGHPRYDDEGKPLEVSN